MADHQNELNYPEIREATVAKLRAEARRADAEAAACETEAAANTARLNAEALRLAEEQAHIVAERKKVELDTAEAAIAYRWKEREEQEKRASNYYHNILHFRAAVDYTSVGDVMKAIDVWRRIDERKGIEPEEQKPIQIVFTSPGGDIIAGFVLYDYLQSLKREGHRVITGSYGMAASMAGILLQAGTERWIGKESWLMIHEASFGVVGKIGEVEDHTAWVKKIQERIVDIFATRANAAKPDRTVQQYKALIRKKWHRADWWLSSDECLKLGFVDSVK